MEFAFEEKTVSHLQLLAEEWLRQEETAELIVPDSEPDAAEVLDCFASCVVRSKECQAGSVLISGGIQASSIWPGRRRRPGCWRRICPSPSKRRSPAARCRTWHSYSAA